MRTTPCFWRLAISRVGRYEWLTTRLQISSAATCQLKAGRLGGPKGVEMAELLVIENDVERKCSHTIRCGFIQERNWPARTTRLAFVDRWLRLQGPSKPRYVLASDQGFSSTGLARTAGGRVMPANRFAVTGVGRFSCSSKVTFIRATRIYLCRVSKT